MTGRMFEFGTDPASGWPTVRFDYHAELVATIKRIVPGHARSYDPKTKVWTFNWLYREALVQAFIRVEQNERAYNDHRIPDAPAPARGGLEDVLADLFRMAPEHLRTPIHRALLKVAHPDVGGDVEMAKALNVAWSAVAA